MRILVGLSGGIDSAIAACYLKYGARSGGRHGVDLRDGTPWLRL